MYLLFAAFIVMAIAFIHFYVPETKGKQPEDFQDSDSIHEQLISESSVEVSMK